MSPVLVTGASGFVGRHVVRLLHERGHDVVAVEHRWCGPTDLEAALAGRPVEWCAHLGWYASAPDYLTSVEGNLDSLDRSLELVRLLERVGCGGLVVAGTCAEYAESSGVLREDDPVAPWSVYGAAKAALRLLVRSSLLSGGVPVAWARLFNVTGRGEDPRRLVPWLVGRLAAGDVVELSPGGQRRDYLDVEDVAAALVALGEARVAGDYNVCSGQGRTLRSLVERLASTLDAGHLLRFGARPYGEHDALTVVGDPARLTAATGWRPRYPPEEVMDRAVAARRPAGPAA